MEGKSLEELIRTLEETLNFRHDPYEQEVLTKSRLTLEKYFSYSPKLAGEIVWQSTLYIDTCCQSAPGIPFPGFQSYCLQNIMAFYDKNNQNLSRLNPKFALTISKKVGAIVNSNPFSSVSFSFGLQSLTDRLTDFATRISPIISSRGTLYFLEHLDAKIKPGFRGGMEDCIFDRPDPEEILLAYSEWSKLQQSDALGFGVALLREIGKRFLLPLPKTETRELMVDEKYLDTEYGSGGGSEKIKHGGLIDEGIRFIGELCRLYGSYFKGITTLNFPIPELVNLTMDFLNYRRYPKLVARLERFGGINPAGVVRDPAVLERLFGVISRNKCQTLEEVVECATIDIPNYKILRRLGEGADGTVYQAQHELLGDVKVKIFNQPKDKIKKAVEEEGVTLVERIRRRIQLFDKSVRDKTYISQLYEVRECCNPKDNERTIYIASDYVDGGAIEERRKDGTYVVRKDITRYAIHYLFPRVLLGLKSLHNAGRILRDVKLRNILFSLDHKTVMIDDLETIAGIEEVQSGFRLTEGSDRYAAPEVVQDIKNASPQSDLYSAAVCLLYMRTRESTLMIGINNLEEPEYSTKLSEMLTQTGMSINYKKFFEKALAFDPTERFADADALMATFVRTDLDEYRLPYPPKAPKKAFPLPMLEWLRSFDLLPRDYIVMLNYHLSEILGDSLPFSRNRVHRSDD